jgi:hypothetical protein
MASSAGAACEHGPGENAAADGRSGPAVEPDEQAGRINNPPHSARAVLVRTRRVTTAPFP